MVFFFISLLALSLLLRFAPATVLVIRSRWIRYVVKKEFNLCKHSSIHIGINGLQCIRIYCDRHRALHFLTQLIGCDWYTAVGAELPLMKILSAHWMNWIIPIDIYYLRISVIFKHIAKFTQKCSNEKSISQSHESNSLLSGHWFHSHFAGQFVHFVCGGSIRIERMNGADVLC